jgi:hypothetical protein
VLGLPKLPASMIVASVRAILRSPDSTSRMDAAEVFAGPRLDDTPGAAQQSAAQELSQTCGGLSQISRAAGLLFLAASRPPFKR